MATDRTAHMFYKVEIVKDGETSHINLWPKTYSKLKAIPQLWNAIYPEQKGVIINGYKTSNTTISNKKRMKELNNNDTFVDSLIKERIKI